MTSSLVLQARHDNVATLSLNRPERHNSLVPALIEEFHAALDLLQRDPPALVVLAGTGRSFSTGGDIAGFLEHKGEDRRAYAAQLVGGLHEAILRLVGLPMPVIGRVQGIATGGALGLVLAADLVAMAEDASFAPFYSEMGFSPDGGWTAMLPERIGPARAGAIQMLNSRVSAAEALALGLVNSVVPLQELDSEIARLVASLRRKSPQSLAATKSLLWSEDRLARLRAGLARERDMFLTMIETREAEIRMEAFLGRRA
ncbi:MAG: enoyl-CoA hydratase/isomerase family protein [Proteobacteria bacterium]|nr:enoyl-CoA hydratase/isomerase family protein [Pseudomonadota bacterium]